MLPSVPSACNLSDGHQHAKPSSSAYQNLSMLHRTSRGRNRIIANAHPDDKDTTSDPSAKSHLSPSQCYQPFFWAFSSIPISLPELPPLNPFNAIIPLSIVGSAQLLPPLRSSSTPCIFPDCWVICLGRGCFLYLYWNAITAWVRHLPKPSLWTYLYT